VKPPETEDLDFLPGGVNRFLLPVMVPTSMPARKEWYLVLCRADTCSDPDNADPLYGDVFVSYPMPNVVTPLPPRNFPVGRTQIAGVPRRSAAAPALVLAALIGGRR